MPKALTYLEILEEREKDLLKHINVTIGSINGQQKKLKELEKELIENGKERKKFEEFLKEYEK